jgi:RimJ/RimL family protein N-acetyltransferase
MHIAYRPLYKDDLAAYRQVRLECLKLHPQNFGSTYEEEANTDSLLLDMILSKKDSNEFFIGAFHENELIGICGFKQEGRVKTNHRGEICQMYVRSSFSGKGIAKRLLMSALTKAFENRSIDQIILSAVAVNDVAVNLYKNLGFVQYGRLENSFKENGKSWPLVMMMLTRARFSEILMG